MKNKQLNSGFNRTRWAVIIVFLGITLICALWKTAFIMKISPIITVLAVFTAAWLHGTVRYGTKNMLVFFLVTWLVSNFFEALSIQTGFPFGHYYYAQLPGPRLFDVPFIVMFAYFATGYASWSLSHVLLGQYSKRLVGKQIFIVPLVAAFLMVMWDLCIDPLCSTVSSLWLWKDGGPYFGVPLQNFFGWFFVVFIIYQVFAWYISMHDINEPKKTAVFSSKLFWMEMVALYAIQGLTQWAQFIGATTHRDIYASMALVSVFTMLFVALMTFFKIKEDRALA